MGSNKTLFLMGPRGFATWIGGTKSSNLGPEDKIRWIEHPRTVFAVVLIGSGIVITACFGNFETVPYSKRTHFVLLSRTLEKDLGETTFEKMKEKYKGKILPPDHRESIRVQRISRDIIDSLKKELRKEKVCSDSTYSPEESVSYVHENVKASSDKMGDEDEILDDQWILQSRTKGKEKGMKSQTAHLEGLKWEVIVVDKFVTNAFCLPGGKIVVFTGLLRHFKKDAEVATIIGHEVGHAVARHAAEKILKTLWSIILQLILYQFLELDLSNKITNLFLTLPFSRRMEVEADYIGLLIAASAGYDPRVAPKVYEKLGRIAGHSGKHDYFATHPSGKKRAQLLARAKVMEEALSIYREAQAGRGVDGFL